MKNKNIEKFLKFIEHISHVPEEEKSFLLSQLKMHDYKIGEILQRQGDPPEWIFFIVKGLVKTFYINESGESWVKGFVWEDKLAAAYVSMLAKIPSNLNIVAIEDVEAVAIPTEILDELYSRHHCWSEISRVINQNILIERELREAQLLTVDATARYQSFLQIFKTIVPRLNLSDIASYIGVTPGFLSNIRKKLH